MNSPQSFVFVVYSRHEQLKYPGREFNHADCLGRIFFKDIVSLLTSFCYGPGWTKILQFFRHLSKNLINPL